MKKRVNGDVENIAGDDKSYSGETKKIE